MKVGHMRLSILLFTVSFILCVGLRSYAEGNREQGQLSNDQFVSSNNDYNPLLNVLINGDVSFLDNPIEINQLSNLTRNQLRILRNTVYAKYGYIFNSGDLIIHFSQFPWYSAIKNNVDDELTENDWKNIMLLQRIERNIHTIYPYDIILKFPQLIGYNTVNYGYSLMDSMYWNIIMSSFMEKSVIYISNSHCIDTESLEFINYFTPIQPYWFTLRPPYSNGNMPYCRNYFGDYLSINIETGDIKEIPHSYANFDNDSDRVYTSDRISTPEYSVVVQSNFLFYYYDMEHRQIPAQNWNDDKKNREVIEAILLDFENTPFYNTYWLETFDNLLSSMNIITKYKLSYSHYPRGGNNGIRYSSDYLISRINNYFNINLSGIEYLAHYLNIYENGFYIYNNDWITVLNVQDGTIVSHYIGNLNISLNIIVKIMIHNNNLYIITCNEEKMIGVYKLLYG
jgi:hypothetical protein